MRVKVHRDGDHDSAEGVLGVHVSASVLSFGPIVVDTITDKLMVGGEERFIAPTPLRILKYLLVRIGRHVSRDEIEVIVLRSCHQRGSSTIRNHIAQLRIALGDAASLVQNGHGGWRIGITASTLKKNDAPGADADRCFDTERVGEK